MNALRPILAVVSGLLGLVLVLPVVVCALPLGLVAALTRALRALTRRFEPEVLAWQQLMAYEAQIGWKPRPHLSTWAEKGDPFRLTTDADGWRGRARLDEADIVVFGDSFAFGFGIDDGSSFADLVPGLRVKGIGANGYNLVQSLLWMERLAPRLSGKLVVWFVYYGNDLYENLKPNLDKYRMPFVREREGGWEVVTSHVDPRPWSVTGRRRYHQRLAEICSPTFLAERAYGAAAFLIEQAADVCRRAGSVLVVIGIPDVSQIDPARAAPLAYHVRPGAAFDPRRPDRELERICRALGVPFTTLADHLDGADHKPADVHWNARGHRKVARLLAALAGEHLRASTPVPAPLLAGLRSPTPS